MLRNKAEIIKDYDESNLPYPVRELVKLDYCWRLNYTMFRHSFVLGLPLTFVHFIWTRSPACWNYTIRSMPYKAFFKNYMLCILLVNAVNTTWSLFTEDYW